MFDQRNFNVNTKHVEVSVCAHPLAAATTEAAGVGVIVCRFIIFKPCPGSFIFQGCYDIEDHQVVGGGGRYENAGRGRLSFGIASQFIFLFGCLFGFWRAYFV